MEFENQTQCLNCGKTLNTAYCGHCGQQKPQRITFKSLLLLIQRGTIEFKSPLLKTILGLTIRPAELCREYLDGRRINFFNPARYAFWLVTFTMIFAAFLKVNMIDVGFENYDTDVQNLQNFDRVKTMLQSGLVYFFFISAFMMAMVAKLFFWKEKYNVFELYVVSLLLSGHLYFLSILLLAIGQYSNIYGQSVILIASILYPAIVIARIYSPTKPLNYIKSLLAAGLGFVIATIMFAFIAAVITGYLGSDDTKVNAASSEKGAPAIHQDM
jgi:hypothetical protein